MQRLRIATALSIVIISACTDRTVTGPTPITSTHPGFDTSIYPGDAAMTAWLKPNSPYEWVGYYLQAPCHRDPSWMGRRSTLTTLGWGLAVLYVGQQTFDGVPDMLPPAAFDRQRPTSGDVVPRARAGIMLPSTLDEIETGAVTCSRYWISPKQRASCGQQTSC